jgi:NAD(P)-dependent dehydrogenase (short-subunit alcohol dehydrogenase family)
MTRNKTGRDGAADNGAGGRLGPPDCGSPTVARRGVRRPEQVRAQPGPDYSSSGPAALGPSLDSAEQEAAAAAKVPLGRVAEPADIVGAVLFFASRLADYVTGQTLPVDGERTTRSA